MYIQSIIKYYIKNNKKGGKILKAENCTVNGFLYSSYLDNSTNRLWCKIHGEFYQKVITGYYRGRS